MRQRILPLQHVIRIQYPHHIASRHLDTLVDGVVHSLIPFADPPELKNLVVPFVAKFFHNLYRPVRRTSVDDDILNPHAPLPQDALNRRLYRRSAVVASRYQRDLHLTRLSIAHLSNSIRHSLVPSRYPFR